MKTKSKSLPELTQLLRDFAKARDWEKFHTPRNLATALSVESAELLEPFQWHTSEGSNDLPPEMLQSVTAEMADVFAYLLLLADKLNVDLSDVLQAKIAANNKKYPADLVRGSSKKYTEYKS